MNRRHFLASAASLAGLGAGAGLLSALPQRTWAAGEDYRVLVVVFLNGGNDGHNVLVPTDAGYNDYQAARANLALPKASLVNLPGSAGGRTYGLHPGLAPLLPLYQQQRMAFVANVGPLVRPATPAQVRANAVEVPPFLLSHSDQVAIQQGWTVSDDMSGWGGRGLELLPSQLRNSLSAITTDNERTLVLGKRSAVSFMSQNGPRYWGVADLARPADSAVQAITRMGQWQFANAYEAEYARTFGNAVNDSATGCARSPRCCRSSASAATGGRSFSSTGAASTRTPTSAAAAKRRRTRSCRWLPRRWPRSTRPTAPTAST
jgi:uncharacterized protein (DUF1501 family)